MTYKIENPFCDFIFDDQDLLSVKIPENSNSVHTPEESPSLCSPSSLSEYRIDSLCGSGSQGTVYRATHKQKQVAIKFFADAGSPDSSGHPAAQKELKMLHASIGLSNVLQLLGWGTDIPTNQFFIVTELHQPIPLGYDLTQIQKISRGLFKGLKELHRQGITHGDVKPQNCLVNAKGKGVIADLGHSFYQEGPRKGAIQTVWYRDPRVFIMAPYDHTIDLWGMGCSLFEFAMKTPLFPGQKDCEYPDPDFIRKLHTLHLITKLLGLPSNEIILSGECHASYFQIEPLKLHDLPLKNRYTQKGHDFNSLKTACLKRKENEALTNEFVFLVARLVTYGKKISAKDALQSPFFEIRDNA